MGGFVVLWLTSVGRMEDDGVPNAEAETLTWPHGKKRRNGAWMNVIVEWCLVESGRPWFPTLKLHPAPAWPTQSGALRVASLSFG